MPTVIRSHGWIQLEPFREDESTGGLSYIAQLDSGNVIDMHIQANTSGIDIEIEDGLTAAEVREVQKIVNWMLNLDQDFSTFYALAGQEPKLAQAVLRAQGRILRSPTLFEDVVKTILTTNTLWAATIRMNSNLVQQFGCPLTEDPARRAFPTAAHLTATNEQTLRSQTRLAYRAPYILQLACSIDSGKLDLESLYYENNVPLVVTFCNLMV